MYLKYENNAFTGSIAKYLPEEIKEELIKIFEVENGDALFFVADNFGICNAALATLRNTLGKELGLIDPNKYCYCWINNWPSFEWSEEEQRYVAAHHPFTDPKDEFKGMLLTHPEKCYSKCYDIVLNGFELGSGSIRIHDQKTQDEMFRAIGLTDDDIYRKFGYFVNALKYGTPPHGGIALGLDRLAMLLTGASSLREIIAFPKSANAICPMSEAPTYISEEQAKELHIKVDID